MYRLHGIPSQNSLKTLYVLEALELDYEFVPVNLRAGENRTPAFLKMNPLGKVPTLEFDGQSLFESGAICRYLANVANSPLYPADKLQRARVDQWMDFFSCHLGRWLSALFFEKIVKAHYGLGEADPRAVEEAHKFSLQQFKVVDGWLTEEQFLANRQLSIADLFAFAYVEQVHAINFSIDDYPAVQAWEKKLAALPAIARARARVGL